MHDETEIIFHPKTTLKHSVRNLSQVLEYFHFLNRVPGFNIIVYILPYLSMSKKINIYRVIISPRCET
jgi:hypothetical protein